MYNRIDPYKYFLVIHFLQLYIHVYFLISDQSPISFEEYTELLLLLLLLSRYIIIGTLPALDAFHIFKFYFNHFIDSGNRIFAKKYVSGEFPFTKKVAKHKHHNRLWSEISAHIQRIMKIRQYN